MNRHNKKRSGYLNTPLTFISLFTAVLVFAVPLLGQDYHLETDKSVDPTAIYETGCGLPPEKATVTLTVTGVGDCPIGGPLDIMLIIDRSTTMLQWSRIDSAKAAAKAFVDLLGSGSRVGLVSFADNIQLNLELTSMNEAGKEMIKTAIDGIQATGYTNIGDAIRTANQELQKHGRSGRAWVEILLSDGLPNRPKSVPDPVQYAITAADTARQLSIPVYTIGLALQNIPQGVEVLQTIADTTGAKYYDSPTRHQLREIFLEIGGEILCRAGTDITVTEVVRDIFTIEHDFTIPPASIEIIPNIGTVFIWYIDEILVGQVWTVSFDIASSHIGPSQPIDRTDASFISYTRNGDQPVVPFPQAYLTVNRCELPQLVCLKIDIFDGEDRPAPGDTIQYDIILTNNGLLPINNAIFNDTPDLHTTLINGSVHTSLGTIVTGNTPGDESVSISLGTISPGQECTILFKVRIDDFLPEDVTSISNQGFLSGQDLDPTPTDDPHTPEPNDATRTSLVRPPHLEGTKRDFLFGDRNGDGLPGPGDTLRYVVEMTNQGIDEALSVTFSDTLEPNVELVAGSVVTSQGTVLQGNGPSDTLVYIHIGTLPRGYAVIINFLVMIGPSLPHGVTRVANQGMVCYAEAACEPTDDPDTPQDDDPTVTESFRILFKRGNTFDEALASSYCPFYRVYDPPANSPDLIQITTYTYDPAHDLYWCDPIIGPLYPGSHLYITYTFRTGSPVDSIFIHIPAKGTKNIERHPVYRATGPDIGLWHTRSLLGFDYYGFDWTVYDEAQKDDGPWPIASEIYLSDVGTPQMIPDTTYVILDTEDPIYHLTYHAFRSGLPLPTIPHPTLGDIPVTTDQEVRITTTVDQTVPVAGNGRLWSYMDIFVFAPGEKVDIDGVPSYADLLGEVSRWVNDPPHADTLDYNYVWNVREATASSQGVATVRIKGRDTASNLVDIEDGEPNTGLHVLIDVFPPKKPDSSKITINDLGTISGLPGAVGTDWFNLGLFIHVYDHPALHSPIISFQAESDGSLNATLPCTPGAGSLMYVTASDHAGHESEASPVIVSLSFPSLVTGKTAIVLGNGSATPGDTIRYTISLRNTGDVNLTNLFFTDVPGIYTALLSGSVTTSQGTLSSGNSPGDAYVDVNLGSLAPSQSITISFLAIINLSIPEDVHEVENQGLITCTQLPAMLTDDPGTPAPNDPTVTPVFPATMTVTFNLNTGWNTLSVPVIPDNPDMYHLFPGAREIWMYNGGYTAAGDVVPGQGYFLYYDFPSTITITGRPVERYTRNLTFGWNLIGSVSQEVPVSSILNISTGQPATESCLDPTAVYEYRNERYFFSTRIMPTKAYWVFGFINCSIEVSTQMSGMLPLWEHTEAKEAAWTVPLQLTCDHGGHSLEFGVSETAGAGYDPGYDRLIPPCLPSPSPLEAYFENALNDIQLSRDIKAPQASSWDLYINASEDIVMSWDVSMIPSDQTILLQPESGQIIDLQDQATLSLTHGHHHLRITITSQPPAFELCQNHPNPFNPSTEIRYQIPAPSRGRDGIGEDRSTTHTTLKIYNILGREIRTLVDEMQAPDRYAVTWDGRDQTGREIPSGIYFYRLEAGSFQETRQMLLLK